jgi:hypothetical protein
MGGGGVPKQRRSLIAGASGSASRSDHPPASQTSGIRRGMPAVRKASGGAMISARPSPRAGLINRRPQAAGAANVMFVTPPPVDDAKRSKSRPEVRLRDSCDRPVTLCAWLALLSLSLLGRVEGLGRGACLQLCRCATSVQLAVSMVPLPCMSTSVARAPC